MEQTVQPGKARTTLWWSFFAGPAAWIADWGLSETLTQHSCSTGHFYVLHVITVVCLAVALSGAVAGYLEFQRFPDKATKEGGKPVDRAYFQAVLGIMFSLGFCLVIIAGGVPRWILTPCE